MRLTSKVRAIMRLDDGRRTPSQIAALAGCSREYVYSARKKYPSRATATSGADAARSLRRKHLEATAQQRFGPRGVSGARLRELRALGWTIKGLCRAYGIDEVTVCDVLAEWRDTP